ncbi:HD domain-containing protein [Microbacterium sp. PMB16]|uniref:HD domain-containing protein n=1 Tax=Microbacterium sp. PMB16 TaxID=3120157 RepID=UPI003F4C5114
MSEPLLSVESDVAREAARHVRSIVHPAIYNHSIRTFHLAASIGEVDGLTEADRETLAVAALFHDAGTADENDGSQRFEVEGADAAARFLEASGWPAERITPVWEAIALHTSPGIAERMGTATRLIRLGVLADFGRSPLASPPDAELRRLFDEYPRLDIERVLGDAVTAQALRRPEKAPRSSWPGGLLAARLLNPDHQGVNEAF